MRAVSGNERLLREFERKLNVFIRLIHNEIDEMELDTLASVYNTVLEIAKERQRNRKVSDIEVLALSIAVCSLAEEIIRRSRAMYDKPGDSGK